MNKEELPPPYDPNAPQNRPRKHAGESNFWPMFGLGVLLFILSVVLCAVMQNPVPLLIALLVAVGSLFFKGRRGIAIGYASTFGVVLLIAAITCGVIASSGHSP